MLTLNSVLFQNQCRQPAPGIYYTSLLFNQVVANTKSQYTYQNLLATQFEDESACLLNYYMAWSGFTWNGLVDHYMDFLLRRLWSRLVPDDTTELDPP